MNKLYFAYGANLNLESMAYRCPAAKLVGRAIAYGKKRVFRYVADVVKGTGKDLVEGALWEITPECEAALDRFEGYPRLYTKKQVRVWSDADGKYVLAMIYVMTSPKRPLGAPSKSYFNTISTGLEDVGWGRNQQVRLAEAVTSAAKAEIRGIAEC